MTVRRTFALLAATPALLSSTACTTPQRDATPSSVRAASLIPEPLRRLEALAEMESLGADRPATGLSDAARTIDPGLPAALVPSSAEYRRAVRTLDEILAEQPIEPPASDIEPPGPDEAREAATLYARARAARAEGDPDAAAAFVEQALDLDPGSARLWQELGESRLEAGERDAGVDALTIAAELGSADARVLLTLASEAASRADAPGVVRWAGAFWLSVRDDAEPAQRAVAGAILGPALLEDGDLLAGAGVLEEALRALEQRPPSPGDPAELVRLRTRQVDLRLRLGDAWSALGRPERAAEAYRAAAEATDRPPAGLVSRWVGALVDAGRPAAAALVAVDHVRRRAGDLGPEEARWVRGFDGLERVGPALAGALAELAGGEQRPMTARRQILRVVVRGVDEPDEALAFIRQHPSAARDEAIASDALRKIVAPQRPDMAAEIVAADPPSAGVWGAALARLSEQPMTLAGELLGSERAGRLALGMGIAAALERPDLTAGVLERGPRPGIDPVLGARLAGLGGLWAHTDTWLDAARQAAGETRRAELLDALLACQRLDEAESLASRIDADANAPAVDLFVAAELALINGNAGLASERLARAGDADPFDERVWERRLGLRVGESELADEGEALRLGRELSERRARGPLFSVLRAREMGGRGMIPESIELLIATNERDPSRDTALPLLVNTARRSLETDPGDARGVMVWLDARLEAFPGSVPAAVARAQLLAVDGSPERALRFIDDAWERIGHPDLARTAEQLLSASLDRTDEAVDRALARLAPPEGVGGSLERAEAGVRGERWATAVAAAHEALPPGGRLSDAQADRWQRVAFDLIRNAEQSGLATEVVALLDRADDSGLPVREELLRGRLLLLARTGDTDRLAAFVREQPLGAESGLIAVQALLAAERVPEGLSLLGDLALEGEGVYEDTFTEWVRLAGALGEVSDVRSMLDRLAGLGRDAEAALVAREQFVPDGEIPGEDHAGRDRADIAYVVALLAGYYDRDQASESILRLALEFDPRHAWAANDLGYHLADRGESLDEAERLLELAYGLLPDEASVADSIGWVRYKLGVFEDETDESGRVVRAGALGLLQNATTLEGGPENPTLHEHLGDTLWRLGRRDEAIKHWAEAEAQYRRQIREMTTRAQPDSRAIDRVNENLRGVRQRIGDAEAGRPPAIAPVPSLDARPDEPLDDPPAEPPADPPDE